MDCINVPVYQSTPTPLTPNCRKGDSLICRFLEELQFPIHESEPNRMDLSTMAKCLRLYNAVWKSDNEEDRYFIETTKVNTLNVENTEDGIVMDENMLYSNYLLEYYGIQL
ncbi:hypothetical protein AVEN_45722-1 [Araneus ventricosus]|uniref:Uncharacterized protein n=1 Tax=Araneus ventricosus TaxID=182803 RepID=A0A4Y2K9R9_ARAVE|nr:hypothetical protein AVEN_45722-1 [Araneus ventricosus]